MREKQESPEKEPSETEASNLLDREFKAMVIQMLKELVQITTAWKKKRDHNQEPNTGMYYLTDLDSQKSGKSLFECTWFSLFSGCNPAVV